jgi:hypothetical protein
MATRSYYVARVERPLSVAKDLDARFAEKRSLEDSIQIGSAGSQSRHEPDWLPTIRLQESTPGGGGRPIELVDFDRPLGLGHVGPVIFIEASS